MPTLFPSSEVVRFQDQQFRVPKVETIEQILARLEHDDSVGPIFGICAAARIQAQQSESRIIALVRRYDRWVDATERRWRRHVARTGQVAQTDDEDEDWDLDLDEDE
jgi:hypothetical protein